MPEDARFIPGTFDPSKAPQHHLLPWPVHYSCFISKLGRMGYKSIASNRPRQVLRGADRQTSLDL